MSKFLIALMFLSLNAFADCESNPNMTEVFTKAKATRKHDVSYRAEELAREAATKQALQDCVMKGAKDCQIIFALTFCEIKDLTFSQYYYGGKCTVVVRGYKESKKKKNDIDFDSLCE